MDGLVIRLDDLTGDEIATLLAEHVSDMQVHSPPESVHVLDLEALKGPEITFWSAWSGDELAGCGDLKQLGPDHGEIKSMRTSLNFRGRGIARAMLAHIIDEARLRGYRRLSLETGSMAAFEPARRLYATHGFMECGPFGDYVLDPYSTFMTMEL